MKNLLIGIIIGVALAVVFLVAKSLFIAQKEIPRNHVAVEIKIETRKEIESIEISSPRSKQIFRIGESKESLAVFPNPGEGTFSLTCIFSNGDTIRSTEVYIEGVYSIAAVIKDDKIDIEY